MSISRMKIKPYATDVRVTASALEVVLADGRQIRAPLEWFPRLKRATREISPTLRE